MNLKEHFKARLIEKLMNEDMAMTVARKKELEKQSDDLQDAGNYEGSYDVQDKMDDELRSNRVYGVGGQIAHAGAPGLGFALRSRDPSDNDIAKIQKIVSSVGQHIVGAPDDPDYATTVDDISSTATHPVYRRMIQVPKDKKK